MTAHEACQKILELARVKQKGVPVYFVPYDGQRPRVQWVHDDRWKQRNRTKAYRRVIVSKDWLQQHAPDVWAVLIAAYLVGGPERFAVPSLLTKEINDHQT